MQKNQKIGKEGENIAVKHLLSRGYKVLERNWRFKNKEIDIIAERDKTIVIVEVKTRSSDFYGQPYVSVNYEKQKFLISAANNYIDLNSLEKEIRFDIISIVISKNISIEHIENAFYPIVNRNCR